MISSIFDGTTIPVLEQVVGFTEARHSVLAGNIANLDTPGYHVRDLSPQLFQRQLKQAIEARDKSHAPLSPGDTSSMQHDPVSSLRQSIGQWLHHDDTNASLEGQVTTIAKNQLQHNVALAILTSQFRLLGSAINERA